jgi:hypothetical protein
MSENTWILRQQNSALTVGKDHVLLYVLAIY